MQYIIKPVSVKKHSSGEEDRWEEKLSEHKIRGRIAVSAAELQGKGLPKWLKPKPQTLNPKTVSFHRRRYDMTYFAQALALQSWVRNCYPASDLVF